MLCERAETIAVAGKSCSPPRTCRPSAFMARGFRNHPNERFLPLARRGLLTSSLAATRSAARRNLAHELCFHSLAFRGRLPVPHRFRRGVDTERIEAPLGCPQQKGSDKVEFTIWSDAAGQPGAKVATFTVSGITYAASLCSAKRSSPSCGLTGDTAYWLIASAGQGTASWNMDPGVSWPQSGPCTGRQQGAVACSEGRQHAGVHDLWLAGFGSG